MRKYSLMFPCHSRVRTSERIYALGLFDGRVKVGITGQPRARAAQHCRRYGAAIKWFHMGPCVPCIAPHRVERAVLAELATRFKRDSSEVFFDLPKSTAIAVIRDVTARELEVIHEAGRARAAEYAQKARMDRAWEAFKVQYVEAAA